MDAREAVRIHFDNIAEDYDYWKRKNSYYYDLIKNFYIRHIPQSSSVIEFGCGTGEVLASIKPKRGLGIDLSEKALEIARNKYPQYEFRTADVTEFSTVEKFDYVIMSDLIDHLSDIPRAIENACKALVAGGRLAITTINPLWNPVFGLLESLKLKMPEGPHCFVPNRFIEFFCRMKGFDIVSKGALIFIPKRIPLLSDLLNGVIPSMPVINRLCWVQTLIAQKAQRPKRELSCSIIIPAYNEEANIAECIKQIPVLKKGYEIIVVDDGSEDATPAILKELQDEIHNLKCIRFPENRGKAHALEEGIRNAKKEAVVILDADMAVNPEDIPLLLEPLERDIADFVSGTRLVYNMEKGAMTQIRRIGNFIFALLWSFILKYNITDTLCGTKAFYKKDFQDIKISGEKWGDFVLLGTAKRLGLRINEIPLRYHARKSGQSKMRPLMDGLRFFIYSLKMALEQYRRD